jgi:hypothetical protein
MAERRRRSLSGGAVSKHYHRLMLTLVVVGASFVPAATAMAGIQIANHNETLLLDV